MNAWDFRHRIPAFAWLAVFASTCALCADEQSQSPSGKAERRMDTGDLPTRPDFSRDIQPIFASACTSCHGGVKQAADLSFVYASSILPPDGWIVEPGMPDESLLLERITSSDPDERMPPPDEHPNPLSAREIELIRRWIEQGAKWQDQWSRTSLVAPEIPDSSQAAEWASQPMDHFVWNRLEREGLEPASPAAPEQWLRRVFFDIVGLPPSPQQLAKFQSQLEQASSPTEIETAYSNIVDSLLSSSDFGQRWAAMWMDLARYADSKGFEKDPHRDIWPYRDWLIAAFNADMPYDQFTIKQLAGDLLPDASFDDIVATAFHRNTQTNTEGGTDDEEYRIAAVIDRLNTSWTVWQATTFGCVQCHSHPYEPLENEEFYACLALFNNTEDVDLNDEFPTLKYVSDEAQKQELVQLESEYVALQQQRDALGRETVQRSQWQMLSIENLESSSGVLEASEDEIRVVSGTVATGSTYTFESRVDGLTALRFRILPVSDDPATWPEQGSVLSHLKLKIVGPESEDGEISSEVSREVALKNVIPDYRTGSYEPEELLSANKSGFGGYPKLFQPRWVVVILTEPISLTSNEVLQLQLKQDASVTGGLSNHLRRFTVEYTTSGEFEQLENTEEYQRLSDQTKLVKTSLSKIKGVRLPVMRERVASAARPTRQFLRGNWLERGELVEPAIPDAFQPSGGNKIDVSNRLEFAQWLVSDANPLAARVWVNRVWAELFGTGIVETLEDFGVSGQTPSHPELLDHLAYKMQGEHKWSLKSLLKSIVLSSTYRQDSRVSKVLRQRDPRNRLLARGPRTRLTAEMLRDQALFAAGVLVDKIGGPSVMPPQPDGVWQQVYSGAKWEDATGDDRYRRGVYTYWKRTSPYPGFTMFDTPSRDVCSPRRIATNTPLQALVTLNSEVYTELAGLLAQRCLTEENGDVQAAIGLMVSRVASRQPSSEDLQDLTALYESLQATREAGKAEDLETDIESVVGESADEKPAEDESVEGADKALSPLAIVALAIINSDWALTK